MQPEKTRPEQIAGAVRERLAAGLFLVTGAGLVVHIITPLPLPVSIAGALVLGVALLVVVHLHGVGEVLPGRSIVVTGLVAAVPAVATYDASRLAYTTLTRAPVSPFKAFPYFGYGLLGLKASPTAAWVAGTGLHVVNGVGFGIAYTILVRERATVANGIVFGLVLEAFMMLLYPNWLQIDALREFVSMSVLGHIVYGATLGGLVRRQLRPREVSHG